MPLVSEALRTAPPGAETRAAAKAVRTRWAGRDDASWNLGARRARAAVESVVTPSLVERLCGS